MRRGMTTSATYLKLVGTWRTDQVTAVPGASVISPFATGLPVLDDMETCTLSVDVIGGDAQIFLFSSPDGRCKTDDCQNVSFGGVLTFFTVPNRDHYLAIDSDGLATTVNISVVCSSPGT